MKRETYRHPKTYDLSARLNCSRPEAIGFLTLLWDWATEMALAGNVGRWPNGAIARACDWTGDPDLFIQSLVGAGWLDADDEHRLVIHDWGQHCENWVRAKAQKLGVPLLGCQKPTSQDEDLRADHKKDLRDDLKSGSFPRDLTEPNQTKPNPEDEPTETGPAARPPKKTARAAPGPIAIPANLDSAEFRTAWADWHTHRSQIRKPMTPLATSRQLNQLSSWGTQRAVAAINLSISNGWQGIYEERTPGLAMQSPQRPRAYEVKTTTQRPGVS